MNPWNIIGWGILVSVALIALPVLFAFAYAVISVTIETLRDRKGKK